MKYKTKIVTIGNSKGVRIPKAMLEEANMVGDVVISCEANHIVISNAKQVRDGWEASFARSPQNEDHDLQAFREIDLVGEETDWD